MSFFKKHTALQMNGRTEPPSQISDFESTEFPLISYRISNNADGIWFCSKCQSENELVHRLGSHPFGHMKCGRCDHVLCSDCLTTDVFSHVANHYSKSSLESKLRSFSYGQVCTSCGLTHQAHFSHVKRHINFHMTCSCGTQSSPQWVRFRIGSNQDWRSNPMRCHQKALDKRLERAIASRMSRLKANTTTTGSDKQPAISRHGLYIHRLRPILERHTATLQQQPPNFQSEQRLEPRTLPTAQLRDEHARQTQALLGICPVPETPSHSHNVSGPPAYHQVHPLPPYKHRAQEGRTIPDYPAGYVFADTDSFNVDELIGYDARDCALKRRGALRRPRRTDTVL